MKINNHFLQKAFVKNFAKNGKVNFTVYGSQEYKSFDIEKTSNKDQPVSEQYFYSDEIENKMMNLESQGISILRYISQTSQYADDVTLSRKELITLKFYLMLSSVRTKKLRDNIENLTGDSLFNISMSSDDRTSQQKQEAMINKLLDLWKDGIRKEKCSILKEVLNSFSEEQGDPILRNVIINVSNSLNSRLLLFKFNSMNLMLSESLNFTEQNSVTGGILMHFSPIFPNIGLGFYFDPMVMRIANFPKAKSTIFQNDVSMLQHTCKYKNHKLIQFEMQKFMKKHNLHSIEGINKFHLEEINKYYTMRDKFIYKVLNEEKEVADICNGMALVHNKNHIVIFQNKNDIHDAEVMIKKRGIYRIEDYQ